MPSGSKWRKKRPVRGARASGLSMGSTAYPATIVVLAVSAHREGLHHPMSQVRLAVLGIGEVTDKPVLSGRQVCREGAACALIQEGDSPERLRRRGALHSRLAPRGEIFHFLSRREPQQNQFVGLRSCVLDPDGLPPRLERLGGLEVVVYQFDGDVGGGGRGGRRR